MAQLFTKLTEGELEVAPLNRFNWEKSLELKVSQAQRKFTPSVLHSIAQSKFENCIPCGIFYRGALCGFVMFCAFNQTCWISRIIIDEEYQGQGFAGRALALLLRHLRHHPDCREIRASVARENTAGLHLFFSAGFTRMADETGDEIILRYAGKSPGAI